MKIKQQPKSGKTDVRPREFIRQLFQNLGSAKAKISWLKKTQELDTIIRIEKCLPNSANPFSPHFFGNPWQRGLTDLFNKRPQQYLYTSSFVAELQWTVATIAHFSAELALFSNLKQQCEREFFKGDFSDSNATLKKIENQFGISLWSLQQKFLLLEYSSGLESNTKYLSALNSEKNIHFFTQVMVNFLSMRAERQLSHDNYQHKLSKYLSSYDAYPKLKFFFERLTGREGNQFDIKDEDLILWLLADGNLIDRFLYTMSLLQRLITSAMPAQDRSQLNISIKVICESLNISTTRNLSLVAFPDRPLTKEEIDFKTLLAFDEYTQGNYSQSATLSAALLLELPTSIQLYNLYIKSLIFSGQIYTSPFKPTAPGSELLNSINSFYRKDDNYKASVEHLAKYAKNYHNTSLGSGLRHLLGKENNSKLYPRWEQIALLESEFIDPKVYLATSETGNKASILKRLGDYYNDSITVTFLSNITTNPTASNIMLPPRLSNGRRLRYTAEHHLRAGNCGEAIPLLETLYNGRMTSNAVSATYPLYDEIVSLLYEAYVKNDNSEQALNIYVANLLHNPLYIHGLNFAALIKIIENEQNTSLLRNINIPIFYSATLNNSQITFISYDNFLNANGCKKPTDLIPRASEYETSHLVYFLNCVCVQKVMSGSFYFTGTETLEKERLQILQYLCKIDQPHSHVYSKEIDEITQRVFVRKGIRKADEGKIHVDIEGIRDSGKRLLAESFRRYIDISSLKGIEKLRLLDTSVNKVVLTGTTGTSATSLGIDIDKLEAEGVRVIFKSHFALFKELFMDVRDRFILSSEYGLDSYLSVRIRHGTLQGQLRSRFEAFHLVTQRNTDTNLYQNNSYWEERLSSYTVAQRGQVQGLLAALSQALDELTRKVKDEIIQIRTELKNDRGLFDFRFDDDELLNLFSSDFQEITDYDEFMDCIIGVLWSRTKRSLESVQNYLSNSLKDSFVQLLTSSQSELRKLLPSGDVSELLASMTNGLTAIQNECDRIARWFTLQGVTYEAFTLREIVNVCVASINNVNPEIQIAPIINVEERSIMGNCFHSFFDILRALLDNALLRSGISGVAPKVAITGKIREDKIYIQVLNSISQQVRDKDPVKALTERIALIREQGVSDQIKREGGTGYYKIAKILEYDLKREDVQILFRYPAENEFEVTLIFAGKELLS